MMTLSPNTFKSVGDTRPPCVVPLLEGKAGPWKPLYIGTTCWRFQKVSNIPHKQGLVPDPSSVTRRRSRSTVSYEFLRSRNTRKRGSWSILVSSWESSNYTIALPVPLPSMNPCKTSCKWRLAHRWVSISAPTTFHRVSSMPMPRVLVLPFIISTSSVHPNSCGISPVIHMCYTMFTRHIQRSISGGVFDCSLGYASLRHCLKCSARM